MKHSQLIGIIACVSLIAVCFLPWSYIESLDLTVDGFHGDINDKLTFGKQGRNHSFIAAVMILFFSLQKIWAKRVNLYVAIFNLGLAIKNFLLFSTCRPECPERQPGLYLLVIISVIILIMTFLPKLEVKPESR